MSESRLSGRRVALIKGVRTPFLKAGTLFERLSALDLGRMVVQELVQRCEIDPQDIDQLVFGQVIPNLTMPSIAREVLLAAGLPRHIDAHTVSRACATGIQALTDAANAIALGTSEVAIVGGTEAMSDPPIFASKPLTQALVSASRAKTLGRKIQAFTTLGPKDFVPQPPAIAEFSTGLSMGESCEKMAKENHVSREEQDAIALSSHQNAARAWKEGRFDAQVLHLPIPPKFEVVADRDNLVREDTTLEALAKLKPAFDRQYGTLTAGNSSPLTDGASAMLIMSEERARSYGLTPLGYLRSYAYAATDPADQLLQGPAYAAPLALKRAGMTLSDIELVEMHEAFAAQVASNLQAFASKSFAEKAGFSAPLGEVNRDILNVNGGSIALGHPFAATGIRVVTQALEELKRSQKNTALCTVCAAGGLGAVVVLERA